MTSPGWSPASSAREPGTTTNAFNRGIRPSIIKAEDLDKAHTDHLRLLVAPALAMLSRKDAARLRAFIEKGGRMIADGRFAVIDRNGFAYESAPGELTDLFGYRELDFLSPYADQNAMIANRFSVIKLIFATTVGKTSLGDPLCALTDSTLYLPTFFGHDISNACMKGIVDSFISKSIDNSCEILESSPGVDLTITHGKGILVGVCNYTHEKQRIRVRVDTDSPCRPLWDGMDFNCETQDGASVLEAVIPGRDIAGFHFE